MAHFDTGGLSIMVARRVSNDLAVIKKGKMIGAY
jgi:hypothetical protein